MPWLAEGEPILNHSHKAGMTGWRKSIEFPGSIQMGYLARFFKQLKWWKLFPANDILIEQPGENAFSQWVSMLKTPDHSIIPAFIPQKAAIELFNPGTYEYTAQWFDPVSNSYQQAAIQNNGGRIRITQNFDHDMLVLLILLYIFLEILTCKKADIFIELQTVLIADYVSAPGLNRTSCRKTS